MNYTIFVCQRVWHDGIVMFIGFLQGRAYNVLQSTVEIQRSPDLGIQAEVEMGE